MHYYKLLQNKLQGIVLICFLALVESISAGDAYSRESLPPCVPRLSSLSSAHDFITKERNLNSQRKVCEKEWTILIYLAMDNNLNDFGEEDLGELAWGKAEFDPIHAYDLVVEADFRNRSGKRYVFEASGDHENISVADTVVKDFYGEEQNTGDPRTLENFLSWVMEELPSRHYLLVMSGHGDGWAATVENNRQHPIQREKNKGRTGNGIAYDESHQDWLTIPDIRRVLTRIENKYLAGKPIDIYAADACYMQQAEVVFELRKQASYIYGSIPIMAYQGLPYREILKNLSQGKYPTVHALAEDLPKIMIDSYQNPSTGKNNRLLASTVDTSKLEGEFLRDLITLGKAGLEWLQTSPELIVDQFLVLQLVKNLISYQNSVIEFSDFLEAWKSAIEHRSSFGGVFRKEEMQLLNAIQRMQETLKATVISVAMGNYYLEKGNRIAGLSIWFPYTKLALQSFEQNIYFSSLHRRGCDCEGDPTIMNAWNIFLGSLFIAAFSGLQLSK